MTAQAGERAESTVVEPQPASTDSDSGPNGRRPRWLLRTVAIGAAVGLLLGGIGAVAIMRHKPADAVCQPIQCSYLTPTVAPDFSLTDQRGRTVSLSSFRGKTVVLSFLDPRCADICPILSAEFVQANRDLGSDASGVVFVGVNVNQGHEAVADVRQFTDTHGMSRLGNWYFLTGSTERLAAVWARWGIAVEPKPDGSVIHTSIVYFVDPAGRITFTAFPVSSVATMPTWGTTIAATVRHLAASA